MKTRFVMVRHAQTNANGQNTYASFDEPLSPLGLRQAEALGGRFSGQSFQTLCHSGSTRTAQTAGAILEKMDADAVVTDFQLREGEIGEWVGGNSAGREEMARLAGIPLWELRPPGGESYIDIDQRVQPFASSLLAGELGQSLLYVGHGRFNTLLIRALFDVPWEQYDSGRMHNAAVTEMWIENGEIDLVAVDDHAHLSAELTTM